MTELICPLCGKPNPPDRDECQYCEAPLKTSGFIASPDNEEYKDLFPPSDNPEEEKDQAGSSLEQAIPDWLKGTEANFLEPSEPKSEETTSDDVSEQIDELLNQPATLPEDKPPAIDDDWLASLLAEAGLSDSSTEFSEEDKEEIEAETPGEEGPPVEGPVESEQSLPPELFEKPDWVTDLEAGSTIKLESVVLPVEAVEEKSGSKPAELKGPKEREVPEWVEKPIPEESPPGIQEPEIPLAPAELPSWLEALKPEEEDVTPTSPVEDVSAADVVTAGPLVGLRGVISAQPTAIKARKPPTYSIKLRVTDEQRARVEMMEELLTNEQKPRPLPSRHTISSRHISRLVIAVVLILPVIWMVLIGSQSVSPPQPGNIPGVIDFIQRVQEVPIGSPILLAFDYEAGFSGEMNLAANTVVAQLTNKNAYLVLVATNPSGPLLAESLLSDTGDQIRRSGNTNYTDLGYLPGGTMGLLGLALSPKAMLPYSLDGNDVWSKPPLSTISSIKDFAAVVVMTNDASVARSWIEQVGSILLESGKPLLFITSTQAEPLIRPYYEATPQQVQGLVAGLAGGLAYSRTIGNIQQGGVWDAFSVGITVSILVILGGAIIGIVMKLIAPGTKES